MTRHGKSADEALEVQSARDEYVWLEEHPCLCSGRWQPVRQVLVGSEENERGSRMTDRMEVECESCGRRAAYYFVVQYEGTLGGQEDGE